MLEVVTVVGPVFAVTVWTWPHQLAILLVIVLLAFYSVYLRALRARRKRGQFPYGSLALCSCLTLGFASGLTRWGYFGDCIAMGLLAGLLLGGSIGMIAMTSRTVAGKLPSNSTPDGVYDRDLDH